MSSAGVGGVWCITVILLADWLLLLLSLLSVYLSLSEFSCHSGCGWINFVKHTTYLLILALLLESIPIACVCTYINRIYNIYININIICICTSTSIYLNLGFVWRYRYGL